MRIFLIMMSLLMSSLLFGQESHSDVKWETNYEKALEISQKSNKPVLMLFTGSDWCPPCKALKHDFFNSVDFKPYSDKFVFLYVDFPRNKDLVTAEVQAQNKILNGKYKVKSLPTLVVVNANGKELDKLKGYNSTGETRYHYDFVKKVLKQ